MATEYGGEDHVRCLSCGDEAPRREMLSIEPERKGAAVRYRCVECWLRAERGRYMRDRDTATQ